MGARLAALLFSCALAANAQTQPDPRQVLEKARERVAQRKDRLPNYTCVQTVDRTYLSRAKPELPVPSCDLMSGEKTRNAYRLKIDATDRLRLDVKISGGSEIGSWVGANHFEEGSVMKLVKGPFGTTLVQIRFREKSNCRFWQNEGE